MLSRMLTACHYQLVSSPNFLGEKDFLHRKEISASKPQSGEKIVKPFWEKKAYSAES